MARAAEDLARVLEPEPGRELLFCPIRGLPIVRSQRVRALPGFHLLSLDAGKEALARGSYDAYGGSFPCNNLEYLHPDDKVFICPEDHKAFLNQMSMQYHRYIRHELEDRKEERKRLRARAAERKARSEAQAAQAQQRQQLQAQMQAKGQAQPLPVGAVPQVVPLQAQLAAQRPAPAAASAPPPAGGASAEAAGGGEGASAAGMAGADAAAQLLAAGDSAPGEEPATAATDDPYAAAAAGEDPYLETSAPDTAAAAAAASPARSPARPAVVVAERPAAGAAVPAASAVPAVAPSSPPAEAARPADGDDEDLYGDIGEREAKRSRTGSTYANAMGAILGGDSDDDE